VFRAMEGAAEPTTDLTKNTQQREAAGLSKWRSAKIA